MWLTRIAEGEGGIPGLLVCPGCSSFMGWVFFGILLLLGWVWGRVPDRLQFNYVVCGDTEGRIAHIKTLVANRKIAFLSVYAPSTGDPSFYSTLSAYLLNLSDCEVVLGADMNAVMTHNLDRSGKNESYLQKMCADKLRQCIFSSSLVDCWRSLNPSLKKYTFLSSRHRTYSRIDYMFISRTLLPLAPMADIWVMTLSDHNSNFLRLVITPKPPRAPRWRFNTKLLQDKDYCAQFKNELKEFITINQGSVDDPRILWDAVKGLIRNNSISYASWNNKQRLKKISDLEAQLTSLENSNQTLYSDDTVKEIFVIKQELNQLLRHKAEFLIQRSRTIHI
uniref:Endonuclease/exonuclease/phosphatase domain-containing protein n=1 Tax=Pygocentrus nattereri TaxID=42514 RepID=A0AAR2L069_PYGNA